MALEFWFLVIEPVLHPAKPTSLPPATPPPATPPAAPTHHLTVAFWNVEWFPGRVPHAGPAAQAGHVAAVASVLAEIDPDILGLEEVADRAAAQLLADRLPGGFHVDAVTEFTREPNAEPSRQQIVLCSRLPLLASGWQPWATDTQGHRPRRGFAFAAYRSAPDEVLLVYGLHLKSNLLDQPGGADANRAEREESARQLLVHEHAETAACTQWGRVRLVVIGGDMNTSLDDPRFAAEKTLRSLLTDGHFLWAWQNIPLPARLTLPGSGFYPATCFDHLFYRGDGVQLRDASIRLTGKTASDHRPVVARFEW